MDSKARDERDHNEELHEKVIRIRGQRIARTSGDLVVANT